MSKHRSACLAPGARRHVLQMLRALASHEAAAARRVGAWLRAITPLAAARAVSLDAFFLGVERAGRSLAKSGVTPEVAAAALRDFDERADRLLEGRFQPAREQLQLATEFALYRGFYAERVSEVRRLESLARVAEEQERRRIGRELHDEAGQSLLLLRLQLEMLEKGAPQRMREPLADARGTAERIVAELRRIVAALSPAVLERLGLAAAVRQMATRVCTACGVSARLRIRGEMEQLPVAAQEVVYRVAQEALQNAAKHARATEINLSLDSTDKRIRLRVADNGAGFAVDAARPAGFGLRGMRERAGLLGGTLDVRSAPGQGTSVTLRLPLSATGFFHSEDSSTPD